MGSTWLKFVKSFDRWQNVITPNFLNALAALSKGKFIPAPDGVLIEDTEGYTIGAIGISGDSSKKMNIAQ